MKQSCHEVNSIMSMSMYQWSLLIKMLWKNIKDFCPLYLYLIRIHVKNCILCSIKIWDSELPRNKSLLFLNHQTIFADLLGLQIVLEEFHVTINKRSWIWSRLALGNTIKVLWKVSVHREGENSNGMEWKVSMIFVISIEIYFGHGRWRWISYVKLTKLRALCYIPKR